MAVRSRIEVDGARELRRAMKMAGADMRDLTRVHRTVATRAKQDVKGVVPVYTGPSKKGVVRGGMKRSVRHSATRTRATVITGAPSTPAHDYFNVIEYSRKYTKKLGPAPRNVGRIGDANYRPGGRYFYPTIHKHEDEYRELFADEMERMLTRNFGR